MPIAEETIDALDGVLRESSARYVAPQMCQRQFATPNEGVYDRQYDGAPRGVNRRARPSQPPLEQRQFSARMHAVLL